MLRLHTLPGKPYLYQALQPTTPRVSPDPAQLADALGEFLGGHGIFVGEPAELAFVECQAWLASLARGELARQGALVIAELLQQLRADGQAVAAGQLLDLADVAEAGAHDHGVVAVGLVVIVNTRDRLHARVFG